MYAPYTALVRIYLEYMDVKCDLTRIGQLCFDHLFIIQMTTCIVHAALLIENLAHIIMYTSPADVLLKHLVSLESDWALGVAGLPNRPCALAHILDTL